MKNFLKQRFLPAFMLVLGFGIALNNAAQAAEERDAQKLLDKSYYAYQDLMSTGNAEVNSLLKDARAILIYPSVGKGGLIIGGEHGKGVLLARDNDRTWSNPAFYDIASLSFGLQAGYQNTRILLIIMEDDALTSILEGKLKIGADASAVLIDEGADGEVSTNTARSDMYYYAQADGGVYVGLSLEGSSIEPRKKLNNAFYDGEPTPTDIVIRRTVSNDMADRLIKILPK